MQSQWVAATLEKANPGLGVELVIVKTTGDQMQDQPLRDIGGKGLFTKELELALLERAVDLAVHSYKDVPVTQPLVEGAETELLIAAVPKREDPRDVICAKGARRIVDLPSDAAVGTSSLRRRCQLLAIRPDLDVRMVRGNIDTRLKKRRSGEFDAILLAMAGLRRSSLYDEADMAPVELEEMLPAAGQAALAIQCRTSDDMTRGIVSALNDPATATCVDLERELVARLDGDCHSPIAALATIEGDALTLRAVVGRRGGEPPVIRADAEDELNQRDRILDRVTQSLLDQGARQMLGGTA
jgi:hydroxymethylbilane synthase